MQTRVWVSNSYLLGLREDAQKDEPLDPMGLLEKLSSDAARVVPLEFASEFADLFTRTLSQAIGEAISETSAFVLSDAFDPRLLVEGAIQPTFMGLPIGDPPGSILMSISKRGISYGLNASVSRIYSMIVYPPIGMLFYNSVGMSDETTIAYELPFNVLEALQDLTEGGLPLGALNPFSPEWGQFVQTQFNFGGFGTSGSVIQFGPGSTMLEQYTQIVEDFDDSVESGPDSGHVTTTARPHV